jgi:hypothetical protein
MMAGLRKRMAALLSVQKKSVQLQGSSAGRSIGVLQATGQQQEREIAQAVENRHRSKGKLKEAPAKAKELMSELSREQVRGTKGFRAISRQEEDGMVALLARSRAAGTDEKYYNAFQQV